MESSKLSKKQQKSQLNRQKLKDKKKANESNNDIPEQEPLIDDDDTNDSKIKSKEAVEEEAYVPINLSKDDDNEKGKSNKKSKKQNKKRKRDDDKDSDDNKNEDNASELTEGFVKKNALTEMAKNAKKKRKGGENRFITFIGNLPYDITVEDIIKHFSKIGETPEIRLLTPKPSKDGKWQPKSKGAAFLEWNTADALQKALKYHHSHLGKRSINVELSAGGGGKTSNRLQKIKQRNSNLEKERSKTYNNKILPSKLAHKQSQSQQDDGDDIDKGGKQRDSTTSGAPRKEPQQPQKQSKDYQPSGANLIPLG